MVGSMMGTWKDWPSSKLTTGIGSSQQRSAGTSKDRSRRRGPGHSLLGGSPHYVSQRKTVQDFPGWLPLPGREHEASKYLFKKKLASASSRHGRTLWCGRSQRPSSREVNLSPHTLDPTGFYLACFALFEFDIVMKSRG